MRNCKSARMWRGFTSIMAVLLALLIPTTYIVNGNLEFLNARLGTTSTQMVDTGDGSTDSTYYDSEFSSLTELIAEKDALAEEISEEGSVLLKNENSGLPIDKNSETVTLWGMNSHTPTLGGMIGSSTDVASDAGQAAYGIEEALAAKGFTVNQDMIDLYSSDAAMAYARRGFGSTGHGLTPSFTATYEEPSTYPVGEIPASLYSDEVLASADDTVAVVVISRDSSEAADYEVNMVNGTEGDSFERPLALSDYERDMIELAKAHSTRVVVLINSDCAMEIDELKQDDEIDSILWVGLPGVNGFLGVADVLSGDENPSGHLSDTYATNSASSPAMQNFGIYTYTNSSQSDAGVLTSDDKGDWYVVETESIYTGYKYYETRYEDSVLGQGSADATDGSSTGSAWSYADEMTYPFGYGLSYTTFEQTLDDVSLEIGGTGTATVTVTNTGSVAGKSVVQLYVQVPYIEGGVEKSSIQLLSFTKTDELEPDESVTVTVEFDPEYMCSYDETAVKADGTAGAWILDAGDYYFAIGNGAHEALNNVLANKLGTTDGLVTITDDEVINADNAIVWTLDARDIETYSENVENALQDMDVNYYYDEDVAEYTTRSDWTIGWTTITDLTATDEMLVELTNSTNELTENGDGVTWGADNGLKLFDMLELDDDGNITGVVEFDDEQWDLLLDEITLDEAIQFIETAADDMENIDSIVLARTYQQDGPLGFTYDQVGGYYTLWSESQASEPTYVSADDDYAAYSMNTMPTEPVVAATWNTELAEREGELFGEDGLWPNVSAINAPGLNLHRTPYCARNHEYYSEDAMLTNLMGVAVCAGGQSKGLMVVPKHFAFNDQETNRSGISTFMTEQAARENSLRAFQGSLSSNVADGVMTAFNRAGATYSGAKAGLLIQILRNEWGYTGWIVTDMINGADYMNWRDIVFAGGGATLTTSAYETSSIGTMAASKELIQKDTEFQEQMKLIIKYYLYNIVQSNAVNGLTADTELVTSLTWFQIVLYAGIAVTAILTLAGAGLTISSLRKSGKRSGQNS
ncbi:MAG: glycoside hydrolase family 3 C-terminal domain-containing protein [Clostridiales bacterium]|nr:glycoside hydrolase family 3 C-terminal domain-containing protein [Clostridiales bacterium]